MPEALTDGRGRRQLRLWPAVVIVVLQWAVRFGLPPIAPDLIIVSVLGGLAGATALLVWWLFFSRAAWPERLGLVIVFIASMAATWPFLHVSISQGAMGALFPMLALPGLCLAFVIWAVASQRLPAMARRMTMVAALLFASGVWTLVRTGGFTGTFDNDLAWRWTPTAEERLLAAGDAPLEPIRSEPVAEAAGEVKAPAAVPAAASATPASLNAGAGPPEAAATRVPIHPSSPLLDWPGFRGRDRDGIVRGITIDTDWSASPPVALWRRPIGPGWSSFAVHGDLLYTQEQRGEDEIVAAYRVTTGAPVWMHRDAARFWESNGGPGPRGTPTVSNGRVYALGATGILNVLSASDGRVFWSRNVGADSDTKIPDWGFSASPILVDDLVVVAAAGTLIAYDAATGMPRWTGPHGGAGYSSPHLVTLNGMRQIVLLDGHGATSVAPADGAKLWDFAIASTMAAAPIVQPNVTPDGDLLIGDGQASAVYRVAVTHGQDGWMAQQRWRSTSLKPYFNDFVVHKGHAFGFDGTILACIDLADGTRKWKGGRYGNGQLILLADQDLLLVISEDGDVALVSAATDKFAELARMPVLQSKTWNHPVVAGDMLFIRNGEEMAAFRLPRR